MNLFWFGFTYLLSNDPQGDKVQTNGVKSEEKIKVLGMAGEQRDGGADGDGFLKGGYKSQLSDDPPWNYIGTS